MSTNPHAVGRTVVSLLLAGGAVLGCGRRPELRDAPRRGDDSVAIGYGTRPRAGVTGAIASFDDEQLERGRALSIADYLERVPGLRVDRTAHEFTVHVRNATGEPLIVVDGHPMRAASYVLAALRPSDIARIDVLQDAGATAAYGVLGGNGVIIVKTKLPR